MLGSPQTFVAYCRVSTDKQSRSGLGLEAQQAAITAHIGTRNRLLGRPYVEVESGRRSDRPELAKAMARCRATGATLLIAKLDRLSRDAHFLLGLEKAGVEFIAADMPSANRLTVGIMAMVAEEEARAISARTKAALAAAKARGKTLGGTRQGQRAPTREEAATGSALAAEARKVTADHVAHRIVAHIEEARAAGAVSLREIAAHLNQAGVPQPRAAAKAKRERTAPAALRTWTATAVRRVLLRTQRQADNGGTEEGN